MAARMRTGHTTGLPLCVTPSFLSRAKKKQVQFISKCHQHRTEIVQFPFLGCDICNEKHDGECPMHGPLHSLRKLVSAGQSHSPLENGSILKFPDEVCLCTSSIPCVGYGVCARKRIPAGTWIGPYEGKLVRPEDIKAETETEYMWEVLMT